jgi:hypothetical protein
VVHLHSITSLTRFTVKDLPMSIRQRRFDSPEKIREKINGLTGKKLTLVLSDSTSVLGELKSVDADGVVLMNGRLKKNRYLFPAIKELYFDENV